MSLAHADCGRHGLIRENILILANVKDLLIGIPKVLNSHSGNLPLLLHGLNKLVDEGTGFAVGQVELRWLNILQFSGVVLEVGRRAGREPCRVESSCLVS